MSKSYRINIWEYDRQVKRRLDYDFWLFCVPTAFILTSISKFVETTKKSAHCLPEVISLMQQRHDFFWLCSGQVQSLVLTRVFLIKHSGFPCFYWFSYGKKERGWVHVSLYVYISTVLCSYFVIYVHVNRCLEEVQPFCMHVFAHQGIILQH